MEGGLQAGKGILPLGEVGGTAQTEFGCYGHQIGEGFELILLGDLRPDAHGISVVVTQGGGDGDVVVVPHFLRQDLIDFVGVGVQRQSQDREVHLSGVVHHHVDVAVLHGGHLQGGAGQAEGGVHLDVGLGLDELLVDVANDVDLGEVGGADGQVLVRLLVDQVSANGDHHQGDTHAHGDHLPAADDLLGQILDLLVGKQALTGDRLLQLGEDEIKEQRQQGNRDGAQQDHLHIQGVEAQIDKPAQTLGAGEGGDGHSAHRGHGGDADTGHDEGGGDGQLHQEQAARARQAHAPGYLQVLGVHAHDAGIGILQNGEEGIHKDHQDGGHRADAQKADGQGQQGDGGDGLHDVGDANDDFGRCLVAGDKDGQGDEQGQCGHVDVAEKLGDQFGPAGDQELPEGGQRE